MALKNNLVFKLHPSFSVVLIAELERTFLLSLKKKTTEKNPAVAINTWYI